MKFTLEITCDNAAFTDEGEESLRAETSAILYTAVEQLDAGFTSGSLRDRNGNTVGTYRFHEEE